MAATVAGATLTEAHRVAQARLGARTTRRLLATWTLLDPYALDATRTVWAAAATTVILDSRRTSIDLATTYLSRFRTFELGDDALLASPIAADALNPAAVTTSLQVTGPIAIKDATASGTALTVAITRARNAAARAGTRHALNGGRRTLINTIATDPHAHGYARVTSSRACAFCAMLASRGPVYSSQRTASRRARDGRRFHDGCFCTVEPVFHQDAPWPDGADAYRALWDEVTAGLSGNDALNAFRRHLSS